MRDLTEMNKLEEYLKAKNIRFDRADENGDPFDRHQIIVFDKDGNRLWDAICNYGSYGCENGLLEIMGDIVPPDHDDTVEGWLTANDVIKRIEWRQTVV